MDSFEKRVHRHEEIKRVFILTLAANLLVAAAKLAVGIVTHSLAMVADGLHSMLDGASNVVGLIGNTIASQPPDEDHPYGHRRFEPLASMIIGGILLLTAWEVITTSISRLSSAVSPEIGIVNFAVMGVTLAVNITVTIYQRRQGKRLQSELLLADAEHTRSDVFASLTVIGSLIGIWLGALWLDTVAALFIVGLILRAAWKIVSQSGDILVDKAVLDSQKVGRIVSGVAGVEEVGRVRSRGPQDDIHLDVDIIVASPTTTEHGEAIAREVRSQLRDQFGGITDIRVSVLPNQEGSKDLSLMARAQADALGLKVHEVIPAHTESGLRLKMHVEVPPDQTVGEAHELVSEFERRLEEHIPDLEKTVTHIEPASENISNKLVITGESYMLAGKALTIAEKMYPDWDWHDIDMYREDDGGYVMTIHVHVDADMPLLDAHHASEKVEARIRAEVPQLHEVTIHTEPHNAVQ